MRFLLILVTLSLLGGCLADKKNTEQKDEVEAVNLYPITLLTLHNMEKCIKQDDTEACREAQDFIETYPWLLTRQFTITNRKEMSEEEWKEKVIPINTHLDQIYEKYEVFKLIIRFKL